MIFECPHCKDLIDADNDWAGSRGTCPHCKSKISVPSQPQPAATYQPPPITQQQPQNNQPQSGGGKAIFGIIFLISMLYLCRDAPLANSIWTAIRQVVPELVPDGAGYIGQDGKDYKSGHSAGRLEGTRYTILTLSSGTIPTDGDIDYLAGQGSSRTEAWRSGFRKGFKEGYKP